MSGLGGGIVFNVGRDIAVNGTTIVDLQPTDEFLRITSVSVIGSPPAEGGQTIAGFRPSGSFTIQDRVFLLINASGQTVTLADQSVLDGRVSSADQEDQIRRGGGKAFLNNRMVLVHYHIGALGWNILG